VQIINGKEVFTTLEELVNPKYTALLLIDLQNDFIMPGGYLGKLGHDVSALHQIIPQVQTVLEAARRSGVLVIHVQMTTYPNCITESPVYLRARLLALGYKSGEYPERIPASCVEGTWGWQIVDELTPLPGEVVIKKSRFSAFIGTNLDIILRSNGIKSVAIVGVVTNSCVLATANDAPFFEYYPILLRDCLGSRKTELHDAAILIMSRGKDIVNSKEVIEIWVTGETC